jgi:putative transposase
MADHGVTYLMNRSSNIWDNTAMQNFFSSLEIERITRRMCGMRDDAEVDVFDHIERYYNPKRRRSTIGSLSPMKVRAAGWISLSGCQPSRLPLRSLFEHPL